MLKKVLKNKKFVSIMTVLVAINLMLIAGGYKEISSVKRENKELYAKLQQVTNERDSYLDQITSLESDLRDVKEELDLSNVKVRLAEMEKKESEGNFIKRLFNK